MVSDTQQKFVVQSTSIRADPRIAVALIAAALAFAVTAFAPQLLNDGDTYLHVAAGARMLADGAILYRDPFSATLAGAPWNAHEWLAEIAMASAFQAAGWSGVVALFAVAAGATAGMLAYHLGRWLDWQAQALVVVLALSCMTASLLARPHLLALPLLEIWLAELVIARNQRRAPSLALLPVMTLWVNIHGSFVLGLALAAALALEALIIDEDRAATLRQWSVFGAGALIAALLNPHFIQGVLFPLTLMSTSSLGNIAEWQATDFARLQPLELVVLAAIYFAVTRRVKIPPLRALIVLGLLHLTLQHQRHQIVFAVAAPLLLAEPLMLSLGRAHSRLVSQTRRLAAVLSIGAIALVASLGATRLFVPLTRADSAVAPMAALEHVPPALRTQPVFNDYGFGGYLIFAGIRPYIDSRVELYGDVFLQKYAAIIRPDRAGLAQTLRANGIRWTILAAQSPVVPLMDAMAGRHRQYSDSFAVVHIRDNDAR